MEFVFPTKMMEVVFGANAKMDFFMEEEKSSTKME